MLYSTTHTGMEMKKILYSFVRWFEDARRKDIERYLSKSQNIHELETRLRDIEHYRTRYGHYI